MKKFVIVMISAIVLFMFLMLNYLVWDKGNLQNQRESDKIEQDWLRGQNRILTATVEELEQANKKLESENASQKKEISDLESKLLVARQKETSDLQAIQKQEEALNIFKGLMYEDVKRVTEKWFLSITQKKAHDSLEYLDKDFMLWSTSYRENEYIEFISNIESISLVEINSDKDNAFIVVPGGEPHVVQANLTVNAYVKEEAQKSMPYLVDGQNTLEMGFKYNSESKKWVILYVVTKK
ncbi:MAG: hypothetical protein ACOYIF_07015 [Acetivibrionales bacterium]